MENTTSRLTIDREFLSNYSDNQLIVKVNIVLFQLFVFNKTVNLTSLGFRLFAWRNKTFEDATLHFEDL